MSAMPVSVPDARDPEGAFPRFTLRDLVASGERALQMRTLAQAAVLGLALALVALALPTERLVGRGSALVTALSGEAPWYEVAAFGATAPLAALLEPLVGSLERAAFLVGALTWALALPWLTSLAMRAGAEPGDRCSKRRPSTTRPHRLPRPPSPSGPQDPSSQPWEPPVELHCYTFAHAIERVAGFGRVPHGVAVGVGCVLAARAAGPKDEAALRFPALLTRLGLPSELDHLRQAYGRKLAPTELLEAMSFSAAGS